MTITGQIIRWTTVGLIVAVTAAPSFSAPTVIAELGSAPLLGPNTTLAELQTSIARNEDRLSNAARMAGMTAAEYRAFRVATQTQRPDWVRVPRRLTAMTFYANGQVQVIHDVEIPPATYGFEYDEGTQAERLRIFLPVACGNLSILRERIRRAAAKKPPMAVSAIPPHVTPAQPAIAAPTTAASPVPQALPTAVPTAAPTIYLGSQPRHGFFPFLAAFFGFVVVGGGNHNAGGGTGGGHGGGCGCTRNPH
ncbi:MAG TPA: hypothetical protein VJN22_02455 [Candidatus Eremiobacteraceae bacterium]|nr:hypothetical protein [Candidatus Eremiobacteraceae bacterium]